MPIQSAGERHRISCPRCGQYALSDTAKWDIDAYLKGLDRNRWILSHALYKITSSQSWPLVMSNLIEQILKFDKLPRPDEQIDLFLLWLGNRQASMGAVVEDTESAISATGSGDQASFAFLAQQLIEAGLVKGGVAELLSAPAHVHSLQLTIIGWQRYDQILRGMTVSRGAFMAMKFGDMETDGLYRDHFKEAVRQTGFELKRLDEGQPAGLIDDRLRVEIRQCRFLIADLTHHNNGAYWEAGYAEGLGKPVIYTCRNDVFDDKERGTHFDTNHHLTIIWDPADISVAVEQLKATIRATLPSESILSDS